MLVSAAPAVQADTSDDLLIGFAAQWCQHST
jgi:hypothetical protein